jgi:hypothetical protein
VIIDLVSFDDLGDSFPRLYRTVSKFFGYTSGTYAVDISKLSDFTRGELSAWLKTQREKKPPAPPVVEPAAPVVKPVAPVEPEAIKDAMDVSKNEERNRVAQQARDEDAFEERLREYERAGLEPTPENADKIVAFIKDHPQLKGYYSAQAADVAVAWLGPKGSNALTWKPQVEAKPPEPAEPAESQESLEPWQLRIDASEPEMKNASVRALQDLIARRRKATNQMYVRRGFSSTF